MARTKATPEQTLIAFFTVAPLDDAERLLAMATVIVRARGGAVVQPARKQRSDRGKPRSGTLPLEAGANG